ncbi:MAG: hypothetical protein WCG83_02475 [Candidatus Peregrinibacteria bacterium]
MRPDTHLTVTPDEGIFKKPETSANTSQLNLERLLQEVRAVFPIDYLITCTPTADYEGTIVAQNPTGEEKMRVNMKDKSAIVIDTPFSGVGSLLSGRIFRLQRSL